MQSLRAEFAALKLEGKQLEVVGGEILAGPDGEPGQVCVCNVKIFEDPETMQALEAFNQKWSWRSYLEEQYPFNLHVSNLDLPVGSKVVIGEAYIKNFATKEKTII